MISHAPTSFEYHNFLRTVLQTGPASAPINVVTEADFMRGHRITYPYRNYFYGVGVAHEDSRWLRIGTREFCLRARTMLIIGPGVTRLWLDDNWSLKNTTVFFTPETFGALLPAGFLHNLPFFRPGADPIIPLSAAQYRFVNELFALLRGSLTQPPVANGLLYALLTYVRDVYADRLPPADSLTRPQAIVRAFLPLVQQHYMTHKDVPFYADQLHLTPKHLSEVVKAETGKPAKRIIDDLVFFEAQSLLKQTGMSVQEIVYWLGYEDASYFTKVFRQKFGLTPLAYRQPP